MTTATPTAKTAKAAWLTNTLAHVAMSTGVGYIAAAYTLSRWFTRPTLGKPKAIPEDFGLSAERFHCVTPDRIRLACWAIEPPRPRGTIVLVHGLHMNRAHTLNRCALFAHHGYRCVTFDLRAHGESTGKRTSFGYHEGRDVTAILDLVKRRWPHEPVGALGISMGAAALCFAAEHVRRCCQAIVLESCYCDIATAFTNRLKNGYPAWFQRLARGVIWVTERRLGLKLEQLNAAHHVAELAPASIFLLTGMLDPHATPEETALLHERARGNKQVWYVPHAGHRDVFEVGGAAYRERMLTFFEQHLAQKRRAAAA